MEMKHKNTVKILVLLIALGITTVFGFHANSQTVTSFIESIEIRSSAAPDTTPGEYDGPQTVKALMNTFDATYNQRYSKARVMALCEDGVVYSSELAISGEIDARYPRVEWIQMLLQSGITIENFDDYRIYLSKRHTLAFLEDHPNLRKIKFLGPPPTDWDTYHTAYIDKLVAKQQLDRVKEVERAKQRIERYKVQVERAKKQFNSQLEQARKQLEDAKKQFNHARKRLERAQRALEPSKTPKPSPNEPNRGEKKKSPYPAL